MYVLMAEGKPAAVSRHFEALSEFTADGRFTADQQKDMQIVPDIPEVE